MNVTDESRDVYVTEQIGPKRSLTPEGFLLCEDVPLARVGEMLYGPGETPIPVGADGIARITRDEAEVFNPKFIASLIGKPFINEHPRGKVVTPDNFRELVEGIIVSARRGTGEFSDCLVGDVLICDAQAINEVQQGKRQVSAGYKAEYDETAPGYGRQYNLVGNHLALVR